MASYNLGQAAVVTRGAWNASTTYLPLNVVTHNGGSYISKDQNSGSEPGVSSGWEAHWVGSTVGIKSIVRTSNTADTTTYTVTMTDNTTATIQISNNGITNIAFTSSSAGSGQPAGLPGATDTYTITYGSGSTTTFLVRNGDEVIEGVVSQSVVSGSSNAISSVALLSYLGNHKMRVTDGTNNGSWVTFTDANESSLPLPATIKATTFQGALTGNVTGNCSGSAATATTATKVGHTLTMGSKTFNGSANVTLALSDLGGAGLSANNTFSGTNTFSGKMTLSGGQFILNSNIYGDSLPAASQATAGRIFFKKA